MSSLVLRRIPAVEEASIVDLSHQDLLKHESDAVAQEENSQKCRMARTCARINSCCCYFLSRISNNILWVAGRACEIKVNEIPYFLTHPGLIVSLLYRERVKAALANLQAIRITTTLSKIEPSHPIEGNWRAEQKCRERMEKLRDQKSRFDILLNRDAPISQAFIDDILKSTLPMQCVCDNFSKKFITFNGTGRLFSLKAFFLEEYPNCDPKIEIDVYRVNPGLIKKAISLSLLSTTTTASSASATPSIGGKGSF
jgi:hypothetical protein